MTVTTQMQLGPSFTPKIVRTLILITALATLISALTEAMIGKLLGIPGLQWWLSLSLEGLGHGLVWQPLTHFFIQPAPWGGLSLGLVIQLLFYMYLLWVLGSAIVQRVGNMPFLRLYLISGFIAGMAAIMVMLLTGTHARIAGSAPAIYAVLVVWSMFNPEAELLLFLTFRVPGKWLVFGYLGALALIQTAQLDLINLAITLGGTGSGYLYATLAWGGCSPFPLTHSLDHRLNHIGQNLHGRLVKIFSSGSFQSKVVDFKTGKPVDKSADDDAFIDAMLAKISRSGEDSLTWRERRRLNKASKRKK